MLLKKECLLIVLFVSLIGCNLDGEEVSAVDGANNNNEVVIPAPDNVVDLLVPTFSVALADLEGSTWNSTCEILLPPLVNNNPIRFQETVYRKEHISVSGNNVTKTRTYYSDDACLVLVDLALIPFSSAYISPQQKIDIPIIFDIYANGLTDLVNLHDLLEMMYPFTQFEVGNNVITQSGLPATEVNLLDEWDFAFKKDIVSISEDKQTLYFGQYADEYFFNCLLTNGFEPGVTVQAFQPIAYPSISDYIGFTFEGSSDNSASVLVEGNSLNTIGADGKVIFDNTLKLSIDTIRHYTLDGNLTINDITFAREDIKNITYTEVAGLNNITYTLESGETIDFSVDSAIDPYFQLGDYTEVPSTTIPEEYLLSIGGTRYAVLHVDEVRLLSTAVATLVLSTGEKIYLNTGLLRTFHFAVFDPAYILRLPPFGCARPVDLDYSKPWTLNNE